MGVLLGWFDCCLCCGRGVDFGDASRVWMVGDRLSDLYRYFLYCFTAGLGVGPWLYASVGQVLANFGR